jgi:hypothetical protein
MSTETTNTYEIEIFKLGALRWFTRVYRVEPNPFADDLKNLVWNITTNTRQGGEREANRLIREFAIIGGEATDRKTITITEESK